MAVNPRFCSILLALCTIVLCHCQAGGEQDSRELMDHAASALEDELFDVAEQYLRRYGKLVGQPTDTRYVVLLARALHGQKRYPEMLALLKKHQPPEGDHEQEAEFTLCLAEALYANNDWASALEQACAFEKRFTASALMPRARRLKAMSLLKLDRGEEAASELEALVGGAVTNPRAALDQLALGQLLASSGRTNEACAMLEQLLSFPPDTVAGRRSRAALGRLYQESNRQKDARRVYEPLVGRGAIEDDSRLQALNALSEMEAGAGRINDAIAILDEGLRQTQNPVQKQQLSLAKGRLLLKAGQIDEGAKLIRNYVGANATNAAGAAVQMELAQSLLAAGLDDKALVEYQNFLETFKSGADLVQAYRGKGEALFNLGRYQESARAFDLALESNRNPGDREQLRLRSADAVFAAGQFKAAADIYGSIVSSCPESPVARTALFRKAECLVQTGDLDEAYALFWQIYDGDPHDGLSARALLRVADIMLERGLLRAADDIFIWIGADYADTLLSRATYGRGIVSYRARRYEEALKYFDRIAAIASASGRGAPRSPEMQPDGEDEVAPSAAYMGARSCFMLNRNDEARRRFREVVSAFPQSPRAPEAMFWLGEQEYNSGAFAESEQTFRQLAERYPQAPLADDAVYRAGRAALMQNEFKRARDWFSLLVKRYPSSSLRAETRFYQGIALCELGQFDAAILIFGEIMKQYPDHPVLEAAMFKKADCQFVLGSEEAKRYEEAVADYQAVLDRPECSSASRLQAKYKIGRCYEKLNRFDEALAQYLQVVYAYGRDNDGARISDLWFVRAAFAAGDILEGRQQWRKAANVYERVVEAGVPAGADAEKRIARLRSEHWLLFY